MKPYEKNLADNMQGVLDELPKAIDDKIRFLEQLDNINTESYILSVLRQILTSSIQIHYIHLDICAEYRIILLGQTTYEKRFGAKHLIATLNESFKRLYGFNNNGNPQKGSEVDLIINSLNEEDKDYYKKEIDQILSLLRPFKDETIFNQKDRGSVYHYAKDIKETYSLLRNLNIEEISTSAIKLFSIINTISPLLDRILNDIYKVFMLNNLGSCGKTTALL